MLGREQLSILAAQRFLSGRDPSVAGAIASVCRLEGVDAGAAPTPGDVRRHVQAMTMQSLGGAGYAESTRARLELAENVMTLLEAHTDVLETMLVGRAAAGRLDGDLDLHIRAYTRRTIGDIAEDLVTAGFPEPGFSTATTRFGRLDRLHFDDESTGTRVVVTRCLPEQRRDARRDLVKGRPVATLRLPEVREEMERMGGEGSEE